MDDGDNSFPNVHHAESSRHAAGGSGLKLVLPPLSAVQALRGKKRKLVVKDEVIKKVPRPIKLKPLREVLTKLIAQIKKKDDYAFFLKPVDVSRVPDYTDVVKRPMDLGTMTIKVERGKYRSLEEFAADLRLVTTNAKIYNPPGTIYHTEADRIETYALDHIAKAAATVIEYETDWNVEVEHDDESVAGADDEDAAMEKEKGTPVEGDEIARVRSPSVASTSQVQQLLGHGRRGARGAPAGASTGTKKPPGALSESLEADGGLPGAKDGLSAFPPVSDWAALMLALKIKGKRYRTKKERMRIEKGGPPIAADGSLDYAEMEAPFTVLSFFVPDPPSRPLLTPLYPTQPSVPAPVNIQPSTTVPFLSSLAPTPAKPVRTTAKQKRRHWTIVRNVPTRGRGKDKDEEEVEEPWRAPRVPAATDVGAYATLTTDVAVERGVKDFQAQMGAEESLFEVLRASVEQGLSRHGYQHQPLRDAGGTDAYWRARACAAEEYVRDVVYGGIDGLAYVRSLAEFVTSTEPSADTGEPPTYDALGMPLAEFVESQTVDPLTSGLHHVLRDAAVRLHDPKHATDASIAAQLDLSENVYPRAAQELAVLRDVARQPIDMAALIHTPDELFRAEDEWAGAAFKEQQRSTREEAQERALAAAPDKTAADYLKFAVEAHRDVEAAGNTVQEGPEVLQHALDHAADAIIEMTRDVYVPSSNEKKHRADTDGEEEEPPMKKLRMNLLALAKRAPLDQITKLPSDLVPEYLRNVVPTISS